MTNAPRHARHGVAPSPRIHERDTRHDARAPTILPVSPVAAIRPVIEITPGARHSSFKGRKGLERAQTHKETPAQEQAFALVRCKV